MAHTPIRTLWIGCMRMSGFGQLLWGTSPEFSSGERYQIFANTPRHGIPARDLKRALGRNRVTECRLLSPACHSGIWKRRQLDPVLAGGCTSVLQDVGCGPGA